MNTLGKYEVLEEIGRGGFGVVYKARDTKLDRIVALKCLAPYLLSDRDFVQRFAREAQAAAHLKHPNIVVIYELGEIDGTHYIAMEYLEGLSLDKLIVKSSLLPLDRVKSVITQMAAALDHAHAQGLIHRDIKPSNIIIRNDDHATLTDFGLAKAASNSSLTQSMQVLGTPHYMSPEQASGAAADSRSDVYSLGVVLYQMLAGEVPFNAETTPALLFKHVYEPPPNISSVRPGLPDGIADVVNKALAKKPAERYQDANELSSALAGAEYLVVEPVRQDAERSTDAEPVPVSVNESQSTQAETTVKTSAPVVNKWIEQEPKKKSGSSLLRLVPFVLMFLVLSVAVWVLLRLAEVPADVKVTPIVPKITQESRVTASPAQNITYAESDTPMPTATHSSAETPKPSPTNDPTPTSTDAPPASATSSPGVPTETPVAPLLVDAASLSGLIKSSEASTDAGIRVQITYADGSPKINSWVAIHAQKTDVSGNPVFGDRLQDGRTDNTGQVFFKLDPGNYGIELGDLVGDEWGSKYNYQVNSGQTTICKLTLARLMIGIRDADGSPLQGRYSWVSTQKLDVSGNYVRKDRIADGRTDNTGIIIYDVIPGFYAVDISDISGDSWGEPMSHALPQGQTTKLVITLGRITVGIKYADGKPVGGRYITLSHQKYDISGNPVRGDRFLDGRTDDTGGITWDVTAGTYVVDINDISGEKWGEPMSHTVTSGATTSTLLVLGQLVVGLKDNSGKPYESRYVVLSYQKKDVSGNIVKGDRILDGRTDNTGTITWNITAGHYVLEVQDSSPLMDVYVEAGKTTLTDGISTTMK